MNAEVEKARVMSEEASGHPTLFSLRDYAFAPKSPQEICSDVGLNWLSALKLHQDGFLSFDPKETAALDDARQAELRFLAALVNGGCDGAILKNVLSGLRKPYAYRIDRIYYDWSIKTWRLLEDVDELEQKFEEWMEELVAGHDLRTLLNLREILDNAIQYVRGRRYRQLDADDFMIV